MKKTSISGFLVSVLLSLLIIGFNGCSSKKTTNQTVSNVVVFPQSATIQLNALRVFTATAYDNAGNPMSNVQFEWSVQSPTATAVSPLTGSSINVVGSQPGVAVISVTNFKCSPALLTVSGSGTTSISTGNPFIDTQNADKIIEYGGLNDSNQRNAAQSLYTYALDNIDTNDPNYAFVGSHANFGLAMIGIWNALATVSGLLSTVSGSGSTLLSASSSGSVVLASSTSSTSGSCKTINLTPYQTILLPVIDGLFKPIEANLKAVTQFTGFSFTINSATLVILSNLGMLSSSLTGQSLSFDMSGAYDVGDVDAMLSLFETVHGGADLLFAYNGVANELINLLMGLGQTGCTMPNPLLDPSFGTLTSNGAQMISDAQYLLADAALNFSNSINVAMQRSGDSSTHVFINYVDNDNNGKYDPPTSTTMYITEDTWNSEILGQVIGVVLKLLPAISPTISSNPLIQYINNQISGKTQKDAAIILSNDFFATGLVNGGIPITISTSMTITIPAISRLIYLTDLQSVSNVVYASIIDTNGQHPIDIIPAIPVLVPRLMPVLEPILAGLGSGSSTLGPLLGLLPTLVTVMFDNTGDAYTSLPVLPSIDLGAFLSNPPDDLKTLAPLYYPTSDPLVGTNTYVAPEPFADGFVHVPASLDPNGAGYWTATASFVPGTDGSASGPGNVISGTVNGTCDAVTIITDTTTGTPLTYTITGQCTGDPTSKEYSGEWYQDSGDHVWNAGIPVCNSTQSIKPCFVDMYGDGKYHNAGDIIEQADEEQAFPFTGLSFSGITMTAWSDTGTDRVPDNLELGYNLSTNPDPYGDDITCTTLISLPPALLGFSPNSPWPIPNTPVAIGNAVCGEKNGQPDLWDGSLLSLLYLGAYVNAGEQPIGIMIPINVILSLLNSSTPSPSFFPRYHYWPGSTFVDPPKLITLNVTATTFIQIVSAVEKGAANLLSPALPVNSLDSIAIALPNDTYMFFPDPSFGGLLTVGQFNWCSKYQNYIGIPYNASAPCDAIAYSTTRMTNAQLNQYVALVNLLINVLTGKVSLSNLGL